MKVAIDAKLFQQLFLSFSNALESRLGPHKLDGSFLPQFVGLDRNGSRSGVDALLLVRFEYHPEAFPRALQDRASTLHGLVRAFPFVERQLISPHQLGA